ncbi:hypothetical protein [Leptodesmis sichuanensis]|uniref:hypothetical protein n=1 Tax=Leptodesmis sichuanensis TaxID=2906798 RepID=UPI001F331EFD|nr:hypothetical protein [Leptodesmis sichuanensis]UIE37645.1 hypothetical protein KIK02_22415 [Leptodesmis sichuanensis A121]
MTYNTEINNLPSKVNLSDCGTPTYKDRLKRWAIVRLFPNQQPVIVARFRKRSDADGHLQFLQQQIPDGQFLVMFD